MKKVLSIFVAFLRAIPVASFIAIVLFNYGFFYIVTSLYLDKKCRENGFISSSIEIPYTWSYDGTSYKYKYYTITRSCEYE